MREVKTLILLGIFVFIGMGCVSFVRVVEENPRLQASLKSAVNIDSFYLTIK